MDEFKKSVLERIARDFIAHPHTGGGAKEWAEMLCNWMMQDADDAHTGPMHAVDPGTPYGDDAISRKKTDR